LDPNPELEYCNVVNKRNLRKGDINILESGVFIAHQVISSNDFEARSKATTKCRVTGHMSAVFYQ